jgi:hypothetical protein
MTPLFKKLNYKEQPLIHVLNAPDSFATELTGMAGVAAIKNALKTADRAAFVLAFCTKQTEIDKLAPVIANALESDGLLWFAYPKGSSKKYKCDFNRDTGWALLGELGFEPVRMVAIDEDWSALRFRRVEHIKVMRRSFAMTKEGQAKVKAAKKK